MTRQLCRLKNKLAFLPQAFSSNDVRFTSCGMKMAIPSSTSVHATAFLPRHSGSMPPSLTLRRLCPTKLTAAVLCSVNHP